MNFIKVITYLMLCNILCVQANQESVKVSVCKLMADNIKHVATLKQQGKTEDEIRMDMIKNHQKLLDERTKYVSKEFIDGVLAEDLGNLIFVFDSKNKSKTPSQIYTIKFNECFKGLVNYGIKN